MIFITSVFFVHCEGTAVFPVKRDLYPLVYHPRRSRAEITGYILLAVCSTSASVQVIASLHCSCRDPHAWDVYLWGRCKRTRTHCLDRVSNVVQGAVVHPTLYNRRCKLLVMIGLGEFQKMMYKTNGNQCVCAQITHGGRQNYIGSRGAVLHRLPDLTWLEKKKQ